MILFDVVKAVVGRGPAVSDLIKLDKEAQRRVAVGIQVATILLGAAVSFIGFVLGAVIVKWVF